MSTEKVRDVKKQNMILTTVLWVVMACCCMTAMIYVASRKTIVIADAMQDPALAVDGETLGTQAGRWNLLLQEDAGAERSFRITLAKGTKAESVVMENRYMDRELWIYLRDADEDDYKAGVVTGDLSLIGNGYCEKTTDGVILKFQMEQTMEYRSTMENDALVIAYFEPQELYEHIVVVNPNGGGTETGCVVDGYSEKEIVLQVAKKLQKKAEWEHIKIYYTRLEDEYVSNEERLALAEAVGADVFIDIGVCVDSEHPEYYGIHSFFNADYFIPECGNIEVADILTHQVTIAASNKAIGMSPTDRSHILHDVKVPAAEVCMGYLSNPQERSLLVKDEYQDKLAEGLAKAIEEIYTKMNVQKEAE